MKEREHVLHGNTVRGSEAIFGVVWFVVVFFLGVGWAVGKVDL